MNHLLRLSTNLVFADDVICALNQSKNSFAMIEFKGVEKYPPGMHDCAVLKERVLKSREIDEMDVYLDKNIIQIKEPYEFKPTIGELPNNSANESIVSETLRRVEVLDDIIEAIEKEGTFKYKNPRNELMRVAVFSVRNSLFKDMLEQIGKSDRLELMTTGKELILKNHRSGDQIKYSGIECEEASVLVTEYTHPFIVSSLLSEEKSEVEDETKEELEEKDSSRIILVDQSFIAIINKCKTLVNSGLGMAKYKASRRKKRKVEDFEKEGD